MKKQISLLLALVLMLTSVSTYAADSRDSFDERLALLREQLAQNIAPPPETAPPIIHAGEVEFLPPIRPDIPLRRISDEDFAPLTELVPYEPGAERPFGRGFEPDNPLTARLMWQSDNVNVWMDLENVDDDGNVWVDLEGWDDPVILDPVRMLEAFEAAVANVTRDFGAFRDFVVHTSFESMPHVGDIHGDGRFNVLMYPTTNPAR